MMSPPSSREANGVRPASLKIHRDSHCIHKTSSSSSISSTSSTTTTASSNQRQRHHQPVIIYTHSPKIIHTQARDFMALVQKLTGLSRSSDEGDSSSVNDPPPPPPPPPLTPPSNLSDNGHKCGDIVSVHDDSSSASSENCTRFAVDMHGGCPMLSTAAAVSPISFEPLPPQNPFLPDIPLFTPSSSDFLCSPMSFYTYPDSSVLSPSVGSISSSVMDVMNAYNEY